MAVFIQTDVKVSINGVDLSDHVVKVTLEDNRDPVEITAMGATNKAYAKGLGDAKATITFLQDFASAKVHATLQPLIGSSTPFAVTCRPTSSAKAPTNPSWEMNALLMNYGMLDGSVGDRAEIAAEFQNGSQTGVSYVTA